MDLSKYDRVQSRAIHCFKGPKTSDDILRVVLFRPYRKGMGPAFVLTMWHTRATDDRGQTYIGYRLTQAIARRTHTQPKQCPGEYAALVVFEGRDFAGSPMHADDSDATVNGLMGFLTLRPGDTDAEYFADYSPAQKEFCEQHAESLSCEVQARFCDENGNVR